jgi:hypothetical protein
MQYRMHPNLCAYISSSFYKGQLCTPPEIEAARRAVDTKGMYWVSYPTYPDRNAEQPPHPRSTSQQNPTEADLVLQLVRPYLGRKYVMVITFYKAQENLIRALLLQHGILEDPDFKTGLRICGPVPGERGRRSHPLLCAIQRRSSGRLCDQPQPPKCGGESRQRAFGSSGRRSHIRGKQELESSRCEVRPHDSGAAACHASPPCHRCHRGVCACVSPPSACQCR